MYDLAADGDETVAEEAVETGGGGAASLDQKLDVVLEMLGTLVGSTVGRYPREKGLTLKTSFNA